MRIEQYDNLEALPLTLAIYGASDYATMEARKGKSEPDYTEHGVWGIDHRGHLWALDWWSGQRETDTSITQFIRLVGLHKPIRWWNEGGVIDKALGPVIRRAMQETQQFTVVESLPSMQDKGAKLQAFHARASAGTVHFPVRRAWADRVIDQLVKFPAGRFDDAADVCGLIGRGIDQMQHVQLPVSHERPILKPFTAQWLEYGDTQDKPRVRYF
jgi:predicted phage terminase large subunit-like protein